MAEKPVNKQETLLVCSYHPPDQLLWVPCLKCPAKWARAMLFMPTRQKLLALKSKTAENGKHQRQNFQKTNDHRLNSEMCECSDSEEWMVYHHGDADSDSTSS